MAKQKPLKIHVIIGSTRQNRFSEKPAQWIFEQAKKLPDVEVELIDLRDYQLPFFDEPMSPSMSKGQYQNDVAKKWAKKVAEADAYIMVTAEYNHGYPAVLKNAIDYVYAEWNKKAVGFLSYGSVGGARAIEQLRQVAIEVQLAPIRQSIHLPNEVYLAVLNENEEVEPNALAQMDDVAKKFLDQLTWWGRALKAARENDNK